MQVTLDQQIQNARKAGYSDEEIQSYLKAKGLVKEPTVAPIQKDSLEGISNTDESKTPRTLESVLRLIQPLISGGAGIAGGTAATVTGNPEFAGLAGSASMAGSDYILNKFLGNEQSHPISGTLGIKPTGDSLLDSATSIGENTLVNEGINQALGPIIKRIGNSAINISKESDVNASGGSSYLSKAANATQATVAKVRDYLLGAQPGKGSVSGNISTLDPTFQQYLKEKGISNLGVDLAEDIFARKQKVEALVNSADKIKQEATDTAKALTGKQSVNLETNDALARSMQLKSQINWTNLNDEIDSTSKALAANPNDKALTKNLEDLMKARLSTFFPDYEKGIAVKDLLPETPASRSLNSPSQVMKVLMYDPNKLQRFFDSGEIKVAGVPITSASPRKDMAGWTFNNIFNNAVDSEKGTLNYNKLINDWDTYKVTDAGRTTFNAQTRGNIDQLFDKFKYASTGENSKGASRYLTLRLGSASVGLGAGLAAGLLSGSTTGLLADSSLVGFTLGMNQLGKLMTNPDVARLMIAAVSDGPLNMAPQVATRLIGRALKGQPVKLEMKNKDGSVSTLDGKIDAMGKFAASTQDQPGANFTVKYPN